MPALGTFLLLAAFVAAACAASASVAGARRRGPRLIESGLGAFYLVAALMTLASAVLVHAFVAGDYRVKYVHRYSDAAQPLFYKLAGYWGGLDGSIMFWVFLLSVFGAVAVYVNRERHRELVPYVVAVIALVEMFFIFLMVIHNNPFETYLTAVPAEGRGLNPLLQNFYMAIHPPSLYIGFVGMTVPFAFGVAALVTGYLDDAWLRAVRRWTMVSWLFLSLGLTLGMLWAYEELGWGGYWGWDPVENAGLLPWFTATAFLHSVMVQERRGMLRVWNVVLVIVTFFLTIFGTFMTRSGVVTSVHAFGEDPELAAMFLAFMTVLLVFSFGLVVYRLPLLRARNELDSWLSREAAFLANNWILLFSAFFVLFATMFPTLSEAVTGERLTVGPPFFNKWMAPIGLMLLFLTGVGPLLAWRKSTPAGLRRQFLGPAAAGVVTGAAVRALDIPFWSSGLCFALCGFVGATLLQEFWRGARVRQRATGTDVFTALVGLVARSRRRYGGYIVHLGIVLMFLGFAGEGFKQEEHAVLAPGRQMTLGRYTLRHQAIRISDDGQKQMITAHVAVSKDGRALGELRPARWFFRKREEEPTTEVGIHRSLAEDLYVVLEAYDLSTQTATYKVALNPLVNWIWAGFAVLALGTAIALLPESTFAFATARAPAGAAATTTVMLLLLVLGVSAARAQHVEEAAAPAVVARSPLERELHDSIICMCGTCGRKRVGECTCSMAAAMRREISELVGRGMTKEQVFEYYIAKYGSQEPLAAPLDRGFNRLAWLLPYLAGASGLVAVAMVAVRWSRRGPAASSAAGSLVPIDRALEARLDDELRGLD
ncbi:MAG TPA: cytochrome c-type biogenesis CcmF C-terminal domain-containing protein [Vicinamibacterales bacterium]|nr:cytochrome c-type biogenesis CcmF C-terminal domain-containing protein [Vicinamibacterales bacterium]